MRQLIPAQVIAVLSEIIPNSETHASLDSLFMYANAPGDPPAGSKPVKVQDWLRRVNKDESVDPLEILGKIIEGYMEADEESKGQWWEDPKDPQYNLVRDLKDKIRKSLARANLFYANGGIVTPAVGTPSRSLNEIISKRNFASIDEEFNRALSTVEQQPREAVSAACNILESVCKTYIQDENLEMPTKQDLQSLWNVVRRDLGFLHEKVEDKDLHGILTGIFSVVNCIGSLRTHASSAHGAGRYKYNLQPRHARLAVHAAHTIVTFVLESWDNRKSRNR